MFLLTLSQPITMQCAVRVMMHTWRGDGRTCRYEEEKKMTHNHLRSTTSLGRKLDLNLRRGLSLRARPLREGGGIGLNSCPILSAVV